MFGYIAPRLDQLTDEQKGRYRSYYCGLCLALREHSSGHSGRMMLSHDMTFLSILLSSLYEPGETGSQRRCPVHPLRKQPIISTPMTDYAADMNLLLMYYKCRDKVLDDRSLIGSAGEKILEKSLERISREYPAQTDGVRGSLEALWEEEKSGNPNPDRLCNLSGVMLASVFVYDPRDVWASQLYSLGEGLGRFVYWMDAWEDLKQDIRHGSFNPLLAYREREDFDTFCQETLEMLIAEAVEHFEVLPLEKDLDILRNVLYSGVWQRYYGLRQRKNRGKTDE